MKHRIYSILYLAIMTCYIVRPVMPYIEYAINKDYIAKYLCIYRDIPGNPCQGTCYLQDQLQKHSESKKPDQNNNNIQNNKIDDHLMAFNVILQPIRKSENIIFKNIYSTILDFSNPVFTPPKSIGLS